MRTYILFHNSEKKTKEFFLLMSLFQLLLYDEEKSRSALKSGIYIALGL